MRESITVLHVIIRIATVFTLAMLPAVSWAGEEAEKVTSIYDEYRDGVTRIIGEAIVSSDAYDYLEYLCDQIGHRISGSPQLEEAVKWAADAMRLSGLEDVRLEEVMVPHWVRGEEQAWISAPTRHDLNILGLGMSVGTPEGGIEAEVVVVENYSQLDQLGKGARGKIVLFDAPYEGYGKTVIYRVYGPSRAAKLGAVAVLVRSIGPVSLDTPHTGTLFYDKEHPKIPAAAVTIEHATMIHRLVDRGEQVRVHLEMGAQTLPDAPSANVIGEVRGSELPDEVVVIGGHLDSWDVGQGAQDDGAGCVIAMEAAAIVKRLGLRPRRTIRVVLFTNEENGSRGGKQYLEDHRDELENTVAAIESDIGNGPADGFRLEIKPIEGEEEGDVELRRERALELLHQIGELLEPISADHMRPGGAGVDIDPIVSNGVPGLGLAHDTSKYFDIHHTHADTFEKIIPGDLSRNVAIMAVMAYVLADMPGTLVEQPR